MGARFVSQEPEGIASSPAICDISAMTTRRPPVTPPRRPSGPSARSQTPVRSTVRTYWAPLSLNGSCGRRNLAFPSVGIKSE